MSPYFLRDVVSTHYMTNLLSQEIKIMFYSAISTFATAKKGKNWSFHIVGMVEHEKKGKETNEDLGNST